MKNLVIKAFKQGRDYSSADTKCVVGKNKRPRGNSWNVPIDLRRDLGANADRGPFFCSSDIFHWYVECALCSWGNNLKIIPVTGVTCFTKCVTLLQGDTFKTYSVKSSHRILTCRQTKPAHQYYMLPGHLSQCWANRTSSLLLSLQFHQLQNKSLH